MQQVIPTEIKNGYNIDYICDECMDEVDQDYFWMVGIIYMVHTQWGIVKCPFCNTEVEILLDLINTPFENTDYFLVV